MMLGQKNIKKTSL